MTNMENALSQVQVSIPKEKGVKRAKVPKEPKKTAEKTPTSISEKSEESKSEKTQKTRTLFFRIQDETYIHVDQFKDILSIGSEIRNDYYKVTINFKESRPLVFTVQDKTECGKVVNRVKDQAKKHHLSQDMENLAINLEKQMQDSNKKRKTENKPTENYESDSGSDSDSDIEDGQQQH